jgi:tetratricopeptide (TPR) repeat protein
MELVKGVPITKYCDEHRLTPRERLELFVPVCQAVQHAHQKGVIHRDLKPSNVLIAPFDGKPVVKVIDFGVAKATGQRLTDATLFTGFGAVVGTPEYMSPEQAETNNQDIDTRSDIYSLGVMLYELLTGSTPLTRKRVKEAALLEVLRVIREEEPPRPSTRLSSTEELPSISAQRQTEPAKLTKLVRGELDWIVMKCLEKDRNRRYETANGLAHDIERYLHYEPVQACPPSAVYRLRKLVRRHRTVVLTAAGFLVLLVAASAISTYQAVRATLATHRADQQSERARENLQLALKALDDIYLQISEERLPRDPQRKKEDIEVLKKALDFYQQFAQQNVAEPSVRSDLIRAFRRVGDIQRLVGENAAADESYRSAINHAEELVGKSQANDDIGELAAAHVARGEHLLDTGQAASAKDEFKQAIERLSPLVAHFLEGQPYTASLARAEHGLGNVLKQMGDRANGEPHYARALETQQKLVSAYPAEAKYRAALAEMHWSAGTWHYQGPVDNSADIDHLRTACDLMRSLARDFPAEPRFRHRLAVGLWKLSDVDLESGYESRKQQEQEAIRVLTRLVADFPSVPVYRADLAGQHNSIGVGYAKGGQYKESAEQLGNALELYSKLAAEYPEVVPYQERLATIERNLAEVTIGLGGDLARARKLLVQSTSRYEKTIESYPSNEKIVLCLVCARYVLSDCLSALGEDAEAVETLGQAEQLYAKTVAALSKRPDGPALASSFCFEVAYDYQDAWSEWSSIGKRRVADQCLGRVIKAYEQAIEINPSNREAFYRLGRVLHRLGKIDKAIACYSKVLEPDTKDPDRSNVRASAVRTSAYLGSHYNTLAWLLATCPDSKCRDGRKAVELAKRAVALTPKDGNRWNTLGVAHYRAGDWKAAIAALEKSMELRKGGDCSDWFFLAMAQWQLGGQKDARPWYDKAVKWMEKNQPKDEELVRFRAEAKALLKIEEKGFTK